MEENLKAKIIAALGIIPDQTEGNSIEIIKEEVFATITDAKEAFQIASTRLTHVNEWASYMEGVTAEFLLHNKNGEPQIGKADQGLLIRVDLPAPGIILGNGYDWVEIEAFIEGETELAEYIGFRARPTANPLNEEEGIAHFYAPTASITFAIYREETILCGAVFDRNIKPNVSDSGNFLVDVIRNSAVGGAAVSGLSRLQWEKLLDAIVPESPTSELESETGMFI